MHQRKFLLIFFVFLVASPVFVFARPPRRPGSQNSGPSRNRQPNRDRSSSRTTRRPSNQPSPPDLTVHSSDTSNEDPVEPEQPTTSRRSQRYSNDDKQFLVRSYYENGRSVTEALKKWSTLHKNRPKPSFSTVMNIVNKFEETGSVENRNKDHYQPTSVRTPENLDAVAQMVDEADRRTPLSTRRIAQRLNMSRSSANRILKDALRAQPFKIQVRHDMPAHVIPKRLAFVNEMERAFDKGSINVKNIIFTDEAHFHLDSYVNKQNYRIWGSEKPDTVREKPLHSERVTVWCGVSAQGLVGPFSFYDTIDGPAYREMLTETILPELEERGWIDNWWWQQDGAPAHTAKETIALLKTHFDTRLIAKNSGTFEWPPYSPDLNPPDYFLWGFLKDQVYATNPENLDQLLRNIEDAIEALTTEMLEKVIENFRKRLRAVQKSQGKHIEGLLV